MKIVKRKIKELRPADYNPRYLSEKAEEDLTESLSKFGLCDPIIININKERKGIVIGGHQRLKIWAKLGNTEIDCVELDLSEKDEKELNIRLNKNTGEFDIELLKEHFENECLLNYGFEDFELGIFDKPDYSILDDEDLDTEIAGFESNVKKAIQIEFKDEDFIKAKELHKYWRDKDANLGAMLLEAMREKNKEI